VFWGQNLDAADGLDGVNDIVGVDLAVDVLVLDFVDLWFYYFVGYC
jgi:hypothetical protein